jgi:2Fe-2S ferredoxin
MSVINVRKRDGKMAVIEAIEGWSVMEVLRDSNVGIEGICGGQCDCASCHVYIDPKWCDQLSSMRDEEEDKLDELPSIQSNSRLSCQIIWGDQLDGLELTIAEE